MFFFTVLKPGYYYAPITLSKIRLNVSDMNIFCVKVIAWLCSCGEIPVTYIYLARIKTWSTKNRLLK